MHTRENDWMTQLNPCTSAHLHLRTMGHFVCHSHGSDNSQKWFVLIRFAFCVQKYDQKRWAKKNRKIKRVSLTGKRDSRVRLPVTVCDVCVQPVCGRAFFHFLWFARKQFETINNDTRNARLERRHINQSVGWLRRAGAADANIKSIFDFSFYFVISINYRQAIVSRFDIESIRMRKCGFTFRFGSLLCWVFDGCCVLRLVAVHRTTPLRQIQWHSPWIMPNILHEWMRWITTPLLALRLLVHSFILLQNSHGECGVCAARCAHTKRSITSFFLFFFHLLVCALKQFSCVA